MIDREKLRHILFEVEIVPWRRWSRFRSPSSFRWSRLFLHVLSKYVYAGIDLPRAIEATTKTVTHFGMKRSLQRVKTAIEGGQSLSEAMREHAPKMFPKTFYSIIEIGEMTGTLRNVLKTLDSYYKNSELLRQKVLATITYPIMILLVASGITLFLLIRIVPILQEIYTDMGAVLPTPTHMLLALGKLMRTHALFLAIGLGCAACAIMLFAFLARRTTLFSRILLWIPLVGSQSYHVNQFHLSALMSILLDSGISVHEALSLCEGDMTLPVFRRSIRKMRNSVAEGKSLSETMAAQRLFSRTFLWLITVGEQKGDLPSSLRIISEHEKSRVEDSIVWAFSVLEPATIIVSSLVIGFTVVAAWLPILQVSHLPI